MAGELEIILIPAIVSAVVSFLVLSFTMKRVGLSKEINRERKLLEEAYGACLYNYESTKLIPSFTVFLHRSQYQLF